MVTFCNTGFTGKDGYKPIDCNLYDYLEQWATFKTPLIITVFDAEGKEVQHHARIVNLVAHDGQEFMELDNGLIIRLDYLVSAVPEA
jgi:Rho-binding antiterminator